MFSQVYLTNFVSWLQKWMYHHTAAFLLYAKLMHNVSFIAISREIIIPHCIFEARGRCSAAVNGRGGGCVPFSSFQVIPCRLGHTMGQAANLRAAKHIFRTYIFRCCTALQFLSSTGGVRKKLQFSAEVNAERVSCWCNGGE